LYFFKVLGLEKHERQQQDVIKASRDSFVSSPVFVVYGCFFVALSASFLISYGYYLVLILFIEQFLLQKQKIKY